MNFSYIVLCFVWITYCFLHSFLANSNLKSFLQLKTGINNRWYRLVYNIFALISLLVIIIFQAKFPSRLIFKESLGIKFLAIFFSGLGIFIMIICIIRYFKQLSGIKNIKPVLVTTGLHRFVRHPLYLGTFIFLTGIILAFPLLSNLYAFIIIITYTLWGIRLEEKKLVEEFGNEYFQYLHKVPMILPRLFGKF